MEGLLNTSLNQSCLKPFGLTPKLCNTSPLFRRTGYFYPKFEPCLLRYNCTYLSRDTTITARGSSIAAVNNDDKGKERHADWELEFLGELDPFGYQAPKKRKKEQKSKLLDDTDGMGWCVRARKMALKLIEAREMAHAIEDLITVKEKKKSKKKLETKKKVTKKSEEIEDGIDYGSEEDLVQQSMEPLNDVGDLKKTVSLMADGFFMQKKEKTMEEFANRVSQFSGPSDRWKEFNLNKAIIEAQTAEEVLEVTSKTVMAVAKGLSPSPLSPLNIATALHHFAKNMERVSMLKS